MKGDFYGSALRRRLSLLLVLVLLLSTIGEPQWAAAVGQATPRGKGGGATDTAIAKEQPPAVATTGAIVQPKDTELATGQPTDTAIAKEQSPAVATTGAIVQPKDAELATGQPTDTETASEQPPAVTTTGATVQPATTPAVTRVPQETEAPQVTQAPEPVVTPGMDIPAPSKPSGLYFCARGRKRVMVSWEPSDSAIAYRLYRKRSGGGKFKLLVQTDRFCYLDKGVRFGRSYRYRILAVNTAVDGTEQVSPFKMAVFQNRRFVATNHQKYTYTEMKADIQGLAKKYHGIVQADIIGKSEDGRNLYDVVVGNPKAKKSLLVVSNLHAREYMTSLLNMNQIEYYLEHYYGKLSGKKVKKIFDRIALHVIPMANPDGTTISQFGISHIHKASLRKLLYRIRRGGTTAWKANARGVDLNRNYPSYFRKIGHRSSEGYSGPHAGSERETRAIVKLTRKLKKRQGLQGVVNYHAMGSIVFGGCSIGGRLRRDTGDMYRLARSITGYADSAGYNSTSKGHGNYREYIVYILKKPSITLEIGRRSCPGPIWEYPSIWRRNATLVFREAALFV